MVSDKLTKVINHKLFGNSAYLFILQLSNFIPFFILPFLARKLSLNEFGIVMLMFTIINLSLIITDFGFNLYGTHKVSSNRKNINVSKLFSAIFFVKLIIFTFVLFLCILYMLYFDFIDDYFLFFIFSSASVFVIMLQPIWLFQGLQKMKNIVYFVTTLRLLYGLLVFLFIEDKGEGYLVITFWFIANAVGLIISMRLAFKEKCYFRIISYTYLKSVIQESSKFFYSRLATTAYTSLNVIILSSISPTSVAFYSSCEKIYNFIIALTSPINRALFPYMSENKDWKIFFNLFFFVLLFLIPFSLLSYTFSEEIIIFIYGESFEGQGDLLSIFIFTALISYAAITFGYSAFGALNRTDIANKTVLFGAFIHVIQVFVLYTLDVLSVTSLAVSFAITESFIALSRIVLFLLLKKRLV